MQRTIMESKKKYFFLGIILLAALFSGIFFHSNAKEEEQGLPTRERGGKPLVAVQTVVPQKMVGKVLLTGQTVPKGQVDIVAKYSGRVTNIHAELGQRVTAGQILISQDTQDTDLSIAQSIAGREQVQAETSVTTASFYANYQKAKEDYQHSLTNYNRYKILYNTGAVSKDSLDSAKQELVAAQAALNALSNQTKKGSTPAAIQAKRAEMVKTDKNIAALKKQRDDLILRSPRNGIIGYRQVEVGALVQPGQKLLSVVDCSGIYVDCQLSEQEAAHLSTGTPVQVHIESLGRVYSGKVIYLSPTREADTQSFTVRLVLTNIDSQVKGGMFARAEAVVLLRKQALTIPKDAVIEENGKYYIFLLDQKKQVKKQQVQLGLSNDEQYEVSQGIKAGDQVAVSNLARLRTGMAVNIKRGEK